MAFIYNFPNFQISKLPESPLPPGIAVFTPDEYRIKLEPVVLGKGKSLYKEILDPVKLKLIKSKIFESGVAGLYYEPIK